MKDAEPPGDLFFRFQQVELGETVQSAVLEAIDAPERIKKLSLNQRLALSTYETAGAAAGLWGEEGFLGVQLEDWRSAFYAKHTGDTADAKKKAFQRVRSDLVEMGRMTAKDDVYTSTDPAVILAVKLQRDKRDIAGQNGKCPDAETETAGTNGTNA
jgi:hypothetical protein